MAGPRQESGMLLPEGVDPNNLPDMKTLRKMRREQKKKGPKDKSLRRVLGYILKYYKAQFILVIINILISSGILAAGMMMVQLLVDNFVVPMLSGEISTVQGFADMGSFIIILAAVFISGILMNFVYNFLMANITQGTLKRIRTEMFSKMQKMPIKYFDSNQSGDIMSCYTNDIDALRQLISQAMPQLVSAVMSIAVSLALMIYYSIWLLLVVVAAIFCMVMVVRKIGGNSARFFMVQQQSLGKMNGYIEESMNGQKVIKVFCHEEQSKRDFDQSNEELAKNSRLANNYANILMPILGNIGNILYVLVAIVGAVLIMTNAYNFSIAGPLTVGYIVAFLQMSKSFAQSVNNVSQQFNAIAMALAGARRIFKLMDAEPEVDNGYVELVHAKYEDGKLVPCAERTGLWAWKHPHKADGTVTYTELKGDIEMHDVDFGYVPEKIVLHDVTLYARPGQHVAFVGSTGAGKTTITNLINRFYDIADGKIRYDGININKIKKSDLRRSLGIVLQDTNLFTGTVRENIKYGKLDATDDEVIGAAKIANAHDFIMRLENGYDTVLESDGANLSQGQRQLLSIARAACADAPVMILDEATSSIDTRTERMVQEGTDRLMQGRTVFLIAHRLSTIHNADVIMVLENGRIIERGSHDQLIAERGTYYKLYTGAFELE